MPEIAFWMASADRDLTRNPHAAKRAPSERGAARLPSAESEQQRLDVDERGQRDERREDDGGHVTNPLDWRVALVHVALDERIGHDGLRAADVRPAAAE